MRDAVSFEALGIPTVILVNDVFAPIAHATATLLRLPHDYVANNVVWLPHPTSTLTDARAAALIDGRIGELRSALLGIPAPPTHAPADATAATTADLAEDVSASLEAARDVVRGLTESLREDGAELILAAFSGGMLEGELRIGDRTCEDGSCIMPTDTLERMIDAMIRPKLTSLRGVILREVRAGTDGDHRLGGKDG